MIRGRIQNKFGVTFAEEAPARPIPPVEPVSAVGPDMPETNEVEVGATPEESTWRS